MEHWARGPVPVTGEPQKMEHSAQGRPCFSETARGKHLVMLTHYSINDPVSVNPGKADYLFKLHSCASLLKHLLS